MRTNLRKINFTLIIIAIIGIFAGFFLLAADYYNSVTAISNETNFEYLQKEYNKILVPFGIIVLSLALLIFMMVNYALALRLSRKRMKFATMHDSLTGLANRDAVQKRLAEEIGSGRKFAIILLDIDNFRSINDFNNFVFGDTVLIEVAERLKSLEKDGDFFAARYDGDNFLLIYTKDHLLANDPEIYYLRQLLNNAIEYSKKSIYLKTSIGIVNSNENFSIDDYLANADIAMHHAKKSGKNKYIFFTEEMREKIRKDAEIGEILEEACQNEKFSVLFQPQIDIATGKIHGYEALVRLTDYNLSPAQFIPIAERDGHISKIGRIVTEKVVKQMVKWREDGLELHRVSINYSAQQINDKGYVNFLKNLIEQHQISAELIGIEITESLFLGNNNLANDFFRIFMTLGIKVALDDFGTGYSNLNYLSYLPIDTVKIDKSTVDTYLVSKPEFISHIIEIVHCLGMKITVEGVETKEQYKKLKEYGADFIQGYYFSKPISGDAIEKFSIQPELLSLTPSD